MKFYGTSLLAIVTSFAGLNAFAGANVQLNVAAISRVVYSDRASNHPAYMEVLIGGQVSQSDAVVQGLPNPIPQTVRILFRPANELDKISFKSCLDLATAAMLNKNQKFTLNLFFSRPDDLVKKIEGGMSQSQFNQFVIRFDDSDISNLGCSLGQ